MGEILGFGFLLPHTNRESSLGGFSGFFFFSGKLFASEVISATKSRLHDVSSGMRSQLQPFRTCSCGERKVQRDAEWEMLSRWL